MFAARKTTLSRRQQQVKSVKSYRLIDGFSLAFYLKDQRARMKEHLLSTDWGTNI
jgi:hypothetical protein